MFEFLRRAFGGRPPGDDIFEQMMERSQKFVLIGRQIADDRVEQGLRKGEFITLSSIEKFIRSNHLYNTEAVINGFLTRIQDYISAEEILNISVESGDVLLAHRDHASEILRRLKSGETVQESGVTENGERADQHDGIKKGQEALAREIALFLNEINSTSSGLAKFLEGMLPATRAIEMLAQRKGERVSPTSGWTVNASLGYSGGTRQGFIRVDDPKLVSFLQLDNPRVYIMIGAKTKKLFGEGDDYGGYFAFSYYVHFGNMVSEQNDIRKDRHFIEEILKQVNVPTSLPELFQRAGYQNLVRRWLAIAQQGASARVGCGEVRTASVEARKMTLNVARD